MRFFFTATLTVLAMLAAILSLPVSSYAFGSNPPLPNTSAPGQGTCASCHGTLTAGSGVTVNAPGSYTPNGKAVSMTVTIPATGGFELEVVTQISNVQAGVLAAGDANGAVKTVGVIQFAYSTAETTSWNFTWTPPTTNVGSVVLYVTGGGHSPNYSNNFVMTPAVATTITVPPVVGDTQTAATTSLTSAGLKLGTVTTASSSTVAAGLVISQTPASGTQVASGSAVNLVISSGASGSPDFNLSASPSSLTIAQGASGTSTIKVTDLNGFTGAVGLGASGMPSGVKASFAGTTLTLTASSTAATGNSTVNITGTSGTTLTHSITLSLTVSGTSSGGALTVSPMSLTFNYQMGGRLPSSRTLSITSTGGSMSFTAKETDPWLSIAPSSGTSSPGNPGSIRASVNPAGMAPGTYGAQININGTTISVRVALLITSGSGGCDNGCGGTPGGMSAQPYVSNSQSGTLAAAWVDNLGASPNNTSDPHNRGLVLARNGSAQADTVAGATIQNVTGIFLTKLGFDFREGIQCSAGSLQFEVVTTQGKHTVDGCNSSTASQSSAPMGWKHFEFKPASAVPPIGSTDQVQSISIVLGKGSSSTGSIAVIDNIEINGVLVGKGTTSTSTSTPTSPSRDD
jgi:hypothetical protein